MFEIDKYDLNTVLGKVSLPLFIYCVFMQNNIVVLADIKVKTNAVKSVLSDLDHYKIDGISFKGEDAEKLLIKLKSKSEIKPLHYLKKSGKTRIEKDDAIIISYDSLNKKSVKKFSFGKNRSVWIDVKKKVDPDEVKRTIDKFRQQVCGISGIIVHNFDFGDYAGLRFFIELKMHAPSVKLLYYINDDNNRKQLVNSLLNLGFDGLFFDIDKSFNDMIIHLQNLKLREVLPLDKKDKSAFEKLRKQIDKTDDELMKLIHSRAEIVNSIAQLKSDHNMKIFQEARWMEIIKSSMEKAKKLGIEKEIIFEILHPIHIDAIKRHLKVFDEKSK